MDRRAAMLVQKKWAKLARVIFYPTKCLCFASSHGHLQLVRELLGDQRVDVTVGTCRTRENKKASVTVSKNGNLEVVRELLKDERVNPSVFDGSAIQ
jgi:hypothetical protein